MSQTASSMRLRLIWTLEGHVGARLTSIDKPTACVVDTLLACRAQLGVTNSLLNEIATDLDA